MKEFRDELLDYLMSQSGFVSITPLKNKYCPNPAIFKLEDQESYCKLRLGMNHILRELKTMGWIDITEEFGTGTSYPHIEGMRHFTFDPDVKARMTTKGEIEYKKSKQVDEPRIYHDNSITVGRDLTGIASTGNVGRDLTNNAEDKESKFINKKSLTINKWVLIVAVIGIIVTIIIYLLQ